MPRNSSGSYQTPAGQPVVSGTVVSAATHNTLISDIASELTSSLDRAGRGAMQAPLRVPDGSVSAPTMAFANQTNTGLYRAGASDVRLAVNGVDQLKATAAGVEIAGLATLTGGLAGQLTRANLPTVWEQFSGQSGNFTTTSATPTYVDVTNLSVNITTGGRPVLVMLLPYPGYSDSGLGLGKSNAIAYAAMYLRVLRGATAISGILFAYQAAASDVYQRWIPAPGVMALDTPAAGTYTYKLQACVDSATSEAQVNNLRLAVFEL